MGPIQLARIPLILSVPLLAVHPFIALLSGILLWVAINFASGFRTILSVAANTGMFLLLNNSVPQRQRGFANGVSLTAMSLSKTVGPSAAGALFSWAETRQQASILPGNHMVFFALNVVNIIAFLMTFEPFLPQSTDKPFTEGLGQNLEANEPTAQERTSC
eukprot:TRINITY_DN13378_c0_g1_i8.p1 TRINITY_DN13378_c0_g1~~TRINITY_DN13378_c0_g1_i8.p1  ORF type:complete len:161 (+),score=25.54 TRINITY_DN13378_c0_g1_i8:620-1102(+)